VNAKYRRDHTVGSGKRDFQTGRQRQLHGKIQQLVGMAPRHRQTDRQSNASNILALTRHCGSLFPTLCVFRSAGTKLE
jgi:hypothetical protein